MLYPYIKLSYIKPIVPCTVLDHTFPHHVKARHAPYGRAVRRRGNGLGRQPPYFGHSAADCLSMEGGSKYQTKLVNLLSPTKLAYLLDNKMQVRKNSRSYVLSCDLL